MPLGALRGAPLAAQVVRDCPVGGADGDLARGAYGALPSSDLGQGDRLGRWTYYAPLVPAADAGLDARVVAQNAGFGPARVEPVFRDATDCERILPCPEAMVAPGESAVLWPSACAHGRRGAMTLRSSEPLAVAVDILDGSGLATYTAASDRTTDGAERPPAGSARAGLVLHGPLVTFGTDFEAAVSVQNAAADAPARVRLTWTDRAGDVRRVDEGQICPAGSRSFVAPGPAAGAPASVASVQVESLPVEPGNPTAPAGPAPITGVLYSRRGTIVASQMPGAGAFTLLAEATGGVASGVTALASPLLTAAVAEPDAEGADTTTDLAIANLVTSPGFTDFAIFIYDQNGLLDYVCQKLNESQIEYIDLGAWGYVNRGFLGSAVVSASFWEHDVFADDGTWLANLVGLGGVAVQRRDAGPGGAIWSDPVAMVELPALLPAAVAALQPPEPLCPSPPALP
jgi:hypothetical protein